MKNNFGDIEKLFFGILWGSPNSAYCRNEVSHLDFSRKNPNPYNDKSEVTSAAAVTDPNYNFGFDYDQIGNRKTYDTTESGSDVQSVYTANNLNQYTAVTNPTNNPTYDEDGNMLSMTLNSGSWTNTFNAENRIIAQEKSDARLEYVYDYMGRRVEKKVYSGSTGSWTLDKHSCVVYDNFEQIEELDALNSNAVAKKRIWSNGKIIADIHGSNSYYALGDTNKNITEYLDSTGAIQAHYEYSPFGKIVKKNGAMQDDFDFRFSSEYFDTETGLVYFNYRYYSPELGRWLSRDPIAEQGGLNLYAMVGNNSVNWWDYLGLTSWSDKTKGSDKTYRELYREYVDDFFKNWCHSGVGDCADLAIRILTGFAQKYGLNIKLTHPRSNWFDKVIHSKDYDSLKEFLEDAQKYVGAENLGDNSNTDKIDMDKLEKGDLLVKTSNPAHVQVVDKKVSVDSKGNIEISITQENPKKRTIRSNKAEKDVTKAPSHPTSITSKDAKKDGYSSKWDYKPNMGIKDFTGRRWNENVFE